MKTRISIGDAIAREFSTDTIHVEFPGDVNLIPYGGVFVIWSRNDIHHKCFKAVEVIDLDSACGFEGAILVEEKSCYIPDKAKRLQAYDCCDAHNQPLFWQLLALQSYGFHDTERNEVYQLDPDKPTSFDRWKAERSTERALYAFIRQAIARNT